MVFIEIIKLNIRLCRPLWKLTYELSFRRHLR